MVNLLYSQLYSEEGLILYTCFDICTKISLVRLYLAEQAEITYLFM